MTFAVRSDSAGTSATLITNGVDRATLTATALTAANGTVLSVPKGFSKMAVFTASGSWTVPAGITSCKVTVVGGGGELAYSINLNVGTGGGGGGTSIKVVTGLVAGNNIPITVGGQNGTSSFGSYCSATGGSNATPTTTTYTYESVLGGIGGIGIGGDLNFTGLTASDAFYSSGTVGAFVKGGSPYTGPLYLYSSPAAGSPAGVLGYGRGAEAAPSTLGLYNGGTRKTFPQPGIVIIEY